MDKRSRCKTGIEALDSDKPILVTLHKKSRTPLLQDVRRRDDIRILEVTPVNRNLLPYKIEKIMEEKLKAVDILISYNDDKKERFQDIKQIFLNDQHPQLRLKLIELLNYCYEIDGIEFLKEQYKNCKDGSVRKKLLEKVGEGN